MVAQHRHGLACVERRSDGEATSVKTGMCGLIKRATLDDVDLGFAFLPAGRGQGYAREAARAAVAFGFGNLGLKRIVAITDPHNTASARVLETVGMRVEGSMPPSDDNVPLHLFAIEV